MCSAIGTPGCQRMTSMCASLELGSVDWVWPSSWRRSEWSSGSLRKTRNWVERGGRTSTPAVVVMSTVTCTGRWTVSRGSIVLPPICRAARKIYSVSLAPQPLHGLLRGGGHFWLQKIAQKPHEITSANLCIADWGDVAPSVSALFLVSSFSFEPNPHWSKAFSEREEIHQYQKNLSEKYGITQHIEFQKKVESTVWNEQDSEWIVTLDNGEVRIPDCHNC